MGSYRDLDIYQKAHQLGLDCHHVSMELPKYELYETGSQLRRASKSVSANIVEGYGRRRYKAEFIKHLIYSHASCDETIEWLTYISTLHPAISDKVQPLIELANITGSSINKFIQSVIKTHNEF